MGTDLDAISETIRFSCLAARIGDSERTRPRVTRDVSRSGGRGGIGTRGGGGEGEAHPRVADEGLGPVAQQVDEQLDDEDDGEAQVELVGHFAQSRSRPVAKGHHAAELGLEDADQEILREGR